MNDPMKVFQYVCVKEKYTLKKSIANDYRK